MRALSVVVIAAVLAGCGASAGVDHTPLHSKTAWWPMYQHSPDRNAVFKSYSIPRDWSYGAKAKINSGLALVGNTLLFTTFSHKLIALDVRNGHRLWQAQVTNVAMSTPIVAGNTVYVGTGKDASLDRNLFQKLEYFKKDVWGVPGGDEIAAFDLRTGAPRWTFKTVGEDMPSAVYDDGRLIFANGDWHAYALRADNGKALWSTWLPGRSTMASAVMAGKAAIVEVCPTSNNVRDTPTVALDASTGKILWMAPYGHCDGAPAYADGKIFVASALPGDSSLQPRTVVAALNARTGKPVWVYRGTTQGLWTIVGSNEVAIAGTYADGTYYQARHSTTRLSRSIQIQERYDGAFTRPVRRK
jgi:outer membrane protein assembly factor BamB